MDTKKVDRVFAAAFVNADATVYAIQSLHPTTVELRPMGHEGKTPSLEDSLCAEYIQSLLEGRRLDIKSYLPELREGAGKYFFGDDQEQYPAGDFDRCLSLNLYDFAIVVSREGDVARLSVNVIKDGDLSKSSNI